MVNSSRGARRVGLLVLLSGALAAFTGCASVIPIGQLMEHPARYDGKTVRIEGQVQGSAGGLGVGEYQVKDATGTLTVITDKGDPPHGGTTVGVKGIFQALVTLGSRGLAVLREQSRSVP